MKVTGEMLIGARPVRGTDSVLRAVNPATGAEMEPEFGGGSAVDVNAACVMAEAAFDAYRAVSLERRAQFLEAIAQGIIDLGDVLVERVMSESALPRGRVEGERGRTAGQLRLFASLAREGRWLSATVDRALPDRKPAARADLRAQRIPLGPVAVFGASNFPLAFSVAGGDTAAALAAGCTVVAKSHPSHLGTSELAGRVIQKALADCGLPEGVFSRIGRGKFDWRGAGSAPGDSGGGVHRIAARGECIGSHCRFARSSHSRLCGDEQHQSRLPVAYGACSAGGEDRPGLDRFGHPRHRTVLHQAWHRHWRCGTGFRPLPRSGAGQP